MVSLTMMVRVAVAELVQRSTALQVFVIMVGQLPLVTDVNWTTRLVSQLSVAVTLGGGGTSPRHWQVCLVGTPTNTGGMVSLTMMVRVAVAELVQRSTALQVFVIMVGQLPLVTDVNWTTRLVSQLSVAVTLG